MPELNFSYLTTSGILPELSYSRDDEAIHFGVLGSTRISQLTIGQVVSSLKHSRVNVLPKATDVSAEDDTVFVSLPVPDGLTGNRRGGDFQVWSAFYESIIQLVALLLQAGLTPPAAVTIIKSAYRMTAATQTTNNSKTSIKA